MIYPYIFGLELMYTITFTTPSTSSLRYILATMIFETRLTVHQPHIARKEYGRRKRRRWHGVWGRREDGTIS